MTTKRGCALAAARPRWPTSPIPSARKRSKRSRITSRIFDGTSNRPRHCEEQRDDRFARNDKRQRPSLRWKNTRSRSRALLAHLLVGLEVRIGGAQLRHRDLGGVGARDHVADDVIGFNLPACLDVAERGGGGRRGLG